MEFPYADFLIMSTILLNFLRKLSVSILIVIFLLTGTELFFRFCFIKSDSISFTLISKAWFKRYWHPINSLGYRDIEHSVANLRGKKTIFVVGDSFAAGQGIEDYKDRFSNVLQDKLGDNWVVVNIAQCGWSTENEYKAVLSYPYKPNIIILSYYIDDMDNSARRIGLDLDIVNVGNRIVNSPSRAIKYLINSSYAFNYFYYRLSFKEKRVKRDFEYMLENCYLNEEVWKEHKKELLNIVEYAKKENIELIMLIHYDPKFIHKIVYSKIIGFMGLNDVKVINLKDTFKKWNKRNLQVSSIDPHPSKKVHKMVGNILFEDILSTH